MEMREKGRIHCVFPMICGSGGSKSRLAKAAGAEPAGQRRDEKLHAVVARSTFSICSQFHKPLLWMVLRVGKLDHKKHHQHPLVMSTVCY